jgi:hypothetical protein
MSKPGGSFLLRAFFKVFLPINASAGLHKNLLKREEGPARDLGHLTKRTQLSCPDHAPLFVYFNNFRCLNSAQPLQFKGL